MRDLQYFDYISSTQFNVYRFRGVSLTNSLILILVLSSLLNFAVFSLTKIKNAFCFSVLF